MKTSRYSEQQIVGWLKQAEAGISVKEVCRQGGFSEATFYKWRAKYGGSGSAICQFFDDAEGTWMGFVTLLRVRLFHRCELA